MVRVLFLLIFLIIQSAFIQQSHISVIQKKGGGYSTGLLVGDNTSGGSTPWCGGARIVGSTYVASDTGYITKGYMNIGTGDSDDSRLVVYDSSDNLIEASGILTSTSTGWNTYTFSGTNLITSGQTYRLCWFSIGVVNLRTDGTGAT